MTTTTMHFGPEWMRTKQPPARTNPSPPLTAASAGASSYSALVTPSAPAQPDKRDLAHPFRYSKEDLIRIYKEGGGKGGLGLEVERWEGIVRELGADPVSLKEMGDAEKKLFAGPLNSEMRRRPSTDYLALNTPALGDRPKLAHAATGPGSPLRERIGGFMGRRRDSTDQPPLTLPRKLSQSSLQAPLLSPREALPSPRARMGGAGGFDGVLGDSWGSGRRRAPDGLLKGNSRGGEGGENQDNPQVGGIKEEEEEHRQNIDGQRNDHQANQPDAPPSNNGIGNTHTLSNTMSNLTLNTSLNPTNASAAPHTPNEGAPAGPPPGLLDMNTVEWIYLDPQGQIQGPFKSAMMQKWYDDGYFTATLLMKRNQIDTDWIPVSELAQRAGNSRPFLTPINPVHNGLPRRDPLLDGPLSAAPDGSFGAPFQPAPSRAFRGGMDPFMHNGGIVPDSPSSTFSGGRFSNGSPDPAVFGGRLGTHQFTDSPVGPRLANIVGTGIDLQRRNTYDESNDPTMMARQPYANFTASRSGSIDVGFNGMESPVATDATGAFAPFNAARGAQGFLNTREGPRLLGRDVFTERQDPHLTLGGQYMNGGYPVNGQTFVGAPYGAQHDSRPLHSFAPQDRQPLPSPLAPQQRTYNASPEQSPWGQENVTPRRPDPFTPDFPTTRNTAPGPAITPAQLQLPPLQIVQNNVQAPPKESPWLTVAQGPPQESWGPDLMTAANLGQHNKQQEVDVHKREVQATEQPRDEAQASAEATAHPESASESVEQPSTDVAGPQKRRRKAQAAAASPQGTPTKAPPAASAPRPPSPIPASATAETRSVWLTDDDKKQKAPGAPLGLREIQEMETKKIEARKAAERERERATRATIAVSPSVAEEMTMSWGLPTSQAGARSSPGIKESPSLSGGAPASPATTTPVWTSAQKASVVKKTMKEIQEEEEKRKAAAKDKESVAAAARRAYADTTTKAATPILQTGGAWTTVGNGGKTNPVVATPPARPAVPATVSTKAVPTTAAPSVAAIVSRVAAPPTPVRSPMVMSSIKLVSPAPKIEESPAPSHDFLKWMTDSLKGLNASVNLEEITSMLLTFPMDPDPSTVEIISDLIYANSTTLDGRRFAAEFVSKRKADVKGGVTTAGKPLSIADVVKTQPKPAQNEWGGFKVVNKKKKGARV